MLAGLLWVASCRGNRSNLVDFGGSQGSTYYQNRKFLREIDEVSWNIVEQNKFVECGKQYFEDNHLRFYYSIEDCMKNHDVNTIILSSVLQYIERPYELLNNIMGRKFKFIIFDRRTFINEGHDRITVQKVPPEIYERVIRHGFSITRSSEKPLKKNMTS